MSIKLRHHFLCCFILMIVIVSVNSLINTVQSHRDEYTTTSNPLLNYIKINEFSSNGSGNYEWIEIVNIGDFTVYFTSLHITDQDGIFINISRYVNYIPKPDAYGNYYILIYMGNGTNDLDYHNNGDDHRVVIYANQRADVLDDDGDDILLYNGTYGTTQCQYIDYVAYYNGGRRQDIDKIPIWSSGMKFTLNGSGYYGYIPTPKKDESVSLVPNGCDFDGASNWYITRNIVTSDRYVRAQTPGKKNVNILEVVVEDIADVNQTQGEEKSILRLKLKGIGTTPMLINSMFFGVKGNILDKEIHLCIYQDANNNGMWDTGDQAMITSYAIFSGHVATVSTPNIQIAPEVSRVYFVTIKLVADADISHTFSLFLIDIDMGRLPDGYHTDEIFMKLNQESKYVRISPRDQKPPKISRIYFEKEEPLGIGEHHISIIFNEVMDTSTQANVTYGLYGYEYKINGFWINESCWRGRFQLIENGPSGKLVLTIEARDYYWNRITEVRYFQVDIQKPYVKSVRYSRLPPYPFGITVNITIEFSESVKGANFTLEAQKEIIYPSVLKYNNTTYVVSISTYNLSQSSYSLKISAASDAANNVMDTYIIENLTMDFEPPLILEVEVKEWPIEDETLVMKILCEDNDRVKSVWAVYKYEGKNIEILGTYDEDSWKIIIVRSSVKPPHFDVVIFVEDVAGNIAYLEKKIEVVPMWKAQWWLWVLIAAIISVMAYLLYDHYKTTRIQRKIKRVIIESEVPAESILIKIGKSLSKLGKLKKGKAKEEVKSRRHVAEVPRGEESETEVEIEETPQVSEVEELNIAELPEVPFTTEEEEVPDIKKKKRK